VTSLAIGREKLMPRSSKRAASSRTTKEIAA